MALRGLSVALVGVAVGDSLQAGLATSGGNRGKVKAGERIITGDDYLLGLDHRGSTDAQGSI
jgi:hypothetical protein